MDQGGALRRELETRMGIHLAITALKRTHLALGDAPAAVLLIIAAYRMGGCAQSDVAYTVRRSRKFNSFFRRQKFPKNRRMFRSGGGFTESFNRLLTSIQMPKITDRSEE
jgi:hypothetical protein